MKKIILIILFSFVTVSSFATLSLKPGSSMTITSDLVDQSEGIQVECIDDTQANMNEGLIECYIDHLNIYNKKHYYVKSSINKSRLSTFFKEDELGAVREMRKLVDEGLCK